MCVVPFIKYCHELSMLCEPFLLDIVNSLSDGGFILDESNQTICLYFLPYLMETKGSEFLNKLALASHIYV